jgi:predicted amidophosphoribosyltransferase
MGPRVACSWCGLNTPVGAACDVCGSPMEEMNQCPYCGDFSPEVVCRNCQDALSTMSNLVRTAPQKPLLSQMLNDVLRMPS